MGKYKCCFHRRWDASSGKLTFIDIIAENTGLTAEEVEAL